MSEEVCKSLSSDLHKCELKMGHSGHHKTYDTDNTVAADWWTKKDESQQMAVLEAELETAKSAYSDLLQNSFRECKSYEAKLERAREMLKSINTENHTAIGSDDFFEGLAYACKTIETKIEEVLRELEP